MKIARHNNESTGGKKKALPRGLKYYESSDFALQQKVRFIFYLSISAIVGLIAIIFTTSYVQITSSIYGQIYLPIIIPELILVALFFTSLFFLKQGFYTVAAHLLLNSAMAGVWFVMWVDKGEIISRLDTVVIIIAILSMTPLLIQKYQNAILLYVFVNIAILFIFIKIFKQELAISNSSAFDFFVDTSFAIIFTGFTGYSIFRINKRSIERAVSDIEKRVLTEEKLQKSDEAYRNMFEKNPQPMFIYDLETLTFLEVNLAAINHYGYSRDEFLSMSLKNIRPKDDIPYLLKKIEQIDNTYSGKTVSRHLKRNGEIIFVEVAAHSVFYKNRKARHVMINDITERKIAENALKESEFKFKSLFETSSDAIFIMNKLIFLDCNSKTGQIFGCDNDQIIGHSPVEFSPEVQPDGNKSKDKALVKVNAALDGVPQFFEWLHKKHDGTEFYAEISLNRVMIKGEYLLHAIVRDISKRKQSENALKESEEKYRTLMENLNEVIMMVDNEDRVKFVNRKFTEILGFTQEEIIGEIGYQKLLDPKDHDVILNANKKRTENVVSHYELTFIAKSGRKIDFLISGAPIKDSYGNTLGSIGAMVDITNRKLIEKELEKHQNQLELLVDERTEELTVTNKELYLQREELEEALNNLQEAHKQLVQAEKMASLGVLAAGVAHEINNPLNFISGGIYGIESYFKDNFSDHIENVSPLFEAVNIGVNRASDIVKSLNRFSRQTDSTTEKCDIHSIINNCLVMLNSEIKNRIEIHKKFTDDSFILIGNEGKLHQAIMNILSNASQAIDNNGTIVISTFLQDHSIFLLVQDTGHGIDDGDLNKIFDPFFTTKEQGKGTGLGLSISYQIIHELKGTIEIESEKGKGTKAIISLPVD